MNQIFEFFLCPVHGLFRPDNLAAIASVWHQGVVIAFQTIQKFRRLGI